MNIWKVALLLVSLALAPWAHGEVRRVDLEGRSIAYHVEGSGPVVLMLASLGRSARDFDDLAGALAAAGYTVIRPEPRGIGGSTGSMQGLGLQDLAADALATLPADAGQVAIIGHAFGQRVARMAASLAPERVGKVVLLAAGGRAPLPMDVGLGLKAIFDPGTTPETRITHVQTLFFAPGNDAPGWRTGWFPAVAAMQVAASRAQPVEAWWNAGQARLLVIQGRQDRVAPPEHGRSLVAELGSRARLVEIDGAGHALVPEQPDALLKAILEFLQD